MKIDDFKNEHPDRANCMTCGAPGELMAEQHFALECKDCRIKELQARWDTMRNHFCAVCDAVLPSDAVMTFDEASSRTIAKIAELKDRKITDAEGEEWLARQMDKIEAASTAIAPINRARMEIRESTDGSPVGIAAKFKNTTPAAEMAHDPVIVCDNGEDE